MAVTTHGHQIPGTPVEGGQPTSRVRCGGSGLCQKCRQESLTHPDFHVLFAKSEGPATENLISLLENLKISLDSIDKQIKVIQDEATRVGIRATQMRDHQGNWVLSPLLCARANVLVAIQIETS